MSKSIRLSEKHGANPTIAKCFWCGKDKNVIALLGKLPGDKAAPRSTWLNGDYEPCNECKKIWEKGIALIEANLTPNFDEQVPMSNAYPTGNLFVLSESGVEALFTEEAATKMKELKIAFVDHEVFDDIAKKIKEAKGE